MRRVFVLLFFSLFLTVGVSSVSAQWREIGSKEVDYRADHDTIDSGITDGDFRRVKLRVERAAVRIFRMEITYANGAKQNVGLRNVIRAGGESRVIDLEGKERVIRKVEFWYESVSLRRQKARVILFGRD